MRWKTAEAVLDVIAVLCLIGAVILLTPVLVDLTRGGSPVWAASRSSISRSSAP
jgi:hypothetical protein